MALLTESLRDAVGHASGYSELDASQPLPRGKTSAASVSDQMPLRGDGLRGMGFLRLALYLEWYGGQLFGSAVSSTGKDAVHMRCHMTGKASQEVVAKINKRQE